MKFEWTITEEIGEDKVPDTIRSLLIDGEEIQAAFKTLRDVAVITNKRLILADKEGLMGKKVDVRKFDRMIARNLLR